MMEMPLKLTAIIVDDEAPARENLRMLIEEFCPEIQVLDTASGVKEAKEKIHQLNPQVVFLDIRMPSGAEGFELLDSIESKSFQVKSPSLKHPKAEAYFIFISMDCLCKRMNQSKTTYILFYCSILSSFKSFRNCSY